MDRLAERFKVVRLLVEWWPPDAQLIRGFLFSSVLCRTNAYCRSNRRELSATMPSPITLAGLIAQVESSGNLYAVHLDPTHQSDSEIIEKCAHYNLCTLTTASALCKMSWGLFQIEGDSLYSDCGIQLSVGAYMASAAAQYGAFNSFIAKRKINYTLADVLNSEIERLNFAHHYNGDPTGYAARMLGVYAQLKGSQV